MELVRELREAAREQELIAWPLELKASDFFKGGPLDRWADAAGHRVNMPVNGADAARAFAVRRTRANAKRRLRRTATPSNAAKGKAKAGKARAGKPAK